MFKYKNLLSLDSAYWFYRGTGEPHSARTFLKNVFASPEEITHRYKVSEYPEHLLQGKNIIGVGGRLTYYPIAEPLLPGSKHIFDCDHPQDLTCLRDIGLLSVFDCLLCVCPSIAVNGLIVNMDYKIIFLEFYEIMLLCTKMNIKRKHIINEVIEEVPQTISGEKLVVHIEQALHEEEKTEPVEEQTIKKAPKTKKKKK